MQAKPIQIDAFQHNVSDIEGDVFLAAILPGVYASVIVDSRACGCPDCTRSSLVASTTSGLDRYQLKDMTATETILLRTS